MRSLHQRGRETKKFLFVSSSCLCFMGWGSSSLDILQVCSCADPGSSQLGTPVAKRCCRGFLEVYRVPLDNLKKSLIQLVMWKPETLREQIWKQTLFLTVVTYVNTVVIPQELIMVWTFTKDTSIKSHRWTLRRSAFTLSREIVLSPWHWGRAVRTL